MLKKCQHKKNTAYKSLLTAKVLQYTTLQHTFNNLHQKKTYDEKTVINE